MVKILDERLQQLKKKDLLYVDGAGLKNNQQNKKGGYTHELFS